MTFAQVVGAGLAIVGQCYPLPVRMRVAGTSVLYNTSAANAQIRDQSNATDCSASAIAAQEQSFGVNCTSAVGSVSGHQNVFQATIDGDL
jgi:hypothetical protein